MQLTENNYLEHYGILRRSGRYPWNSGGNENASESVRNQSFLGTVSKLRKQGLSDSEIARGFGISRNELTATRTRALAQQKQEKILTAQRLKDKGLSNVAIGQRMGAPESSVRALLAPGAADRAKALHSTSTMLKEHVDKKEMIDVGKGVEAQIGVTRSRLDTAVAFLREEGYILHNLKIPQLNSPGNFTNLKVLAKPGMSFAEVSRNRANIQQITDYSVDHGRSFFGFQPPISVSSRKIGVNYGEEGAKADGVIYIRPGVDNLRIGSSRYAQVRIAVDGTHYLKGMAVYKDDLPEGVNLVFNTNKDSKIPLKNKDPKGDSIFKPMDDDPDFPFGSIVRQIHGSDGKVNSAMNIVNEEGDWDTWSRNLSSQMLSKQSPKLATQQLNLTHERRLREFNEINSLTNPTVRQQLLLKFADSTDSAAVHLKAASLPRQASKVILPIKSVKLNEVYAPSMRHGERVVLVRHPHGGTFEIPELTVNNRNPEARKIIGNAAADAIGIHHKTAQHLSGADFDGDAVLVIPNNKRTKTAGVTITPALERLKDFDPQVYKLSKNSPILRITGSQKQNEMGRVSNLITDMTINGADSNELARAIRHSMVVIDSEKHNLDYRQSEKDNSILSLKEKYQGKKRGGASTLISRAGAETYINERKQRPAKEGGFIDTATGRKVYVETGRTKPERVRGVETGRLVPRKEKYDRLAITDDAHSLITSPGTEMERIYADHSNRLKAMGNAARKEAVNLKGMPYSKSAKAAYSNEVSSLNAKLNVAQKNAPLERQAQVLAKAQVTLKRQRNPHMEPEDVKKINQQALNEARNRTGAKKNVIVLTQNEWDAIQAGAISTHKLKEILTNSDLDGVKRLAMPKKAFKMTSTKMARAQSMIAAGFTLQEVADQLGVGLTTLKVGLNG